jgi:hypothetical protein
MTVFDETLDQEPEVETQETENDQLSELQKLQKRLADKDAFIERMKAEQAGMRAELQTQARLQEILDKISTGSPSTPTPPAQEEQDTPTQTMDPAKLAALVEETVARRETTATQKANAKQVALKLKAVHGPGFVEKVKAHVETLGMTPGQFDQIAAQAPKAALELLGIRDEPQRDGTPFAPPRSQVNSESFRPKSGEKGFKDYEAMRRSADPKVRAEYWSPKVQNEIHKKNAEYAQRDLDFTKT